MASSSSSSTIPEIRELQDQSPQDRLMIQVDAEFVFSVKHDFLTKHLQEGQLGPTRIPLTSDEILAGALPLIAGLLRRTQVGRPSLMGDVQITAPQTPNYDQWTVALTSAVRVEADPLEDQEAVHQWQRDCPDCWSIGVKLTSPGAHTLLLSKMVDELKKIEATLTDTEPYGTFDPVDAGDDAKVQFWAPDGHGDYYSWTNASCSLITRISIGSLEVGKNLIALWSTFERDMEALHPDRRGLPHAPAFQSALNPGLTGAEFRNLIYQTKHAEDLQLLICPKGQDERTTKIQIAEVEQGVWQVEFKDRPGTLQARSIIYWLDELSYMAEFARELASEALTFDVVGSDYEALDLNHLWGYGINRDAALFEDLH